jgi:serine/threonine protein kinase
MALKPGTQVGPYEITAPLGAGGMGEVYRSTDIKLKREVAIKVLPDDVARDPEIGGGRSSRRVACAHPPPVSFGMISTYP